MASQLCLDRIAAQKPPFNRQCPSICSKRNFIDGTHCAAMGLPPETPFLTEDPDFGGPGKPGWCYCCCSCFTHGTPIEKSPKEYVLVQDIKRGDELLVCDLKEKLHWRPGKVKTSSGDVEAADYAGMYFLHYDFELGGGQAEARWLVVSPDHLFVHVDGQGNRTLKAVQHLIPGDPLAQHDGQLAHVRFVNIGNYTTALQTIEMEGDVTTSPDGHLLNANGLVTGDYALQAHYARGKLDTRHVWEPKAGGRALEVGEKGYATRFASPAAAAFLQNKAAWPQGFSPMHEDLVNVPAGAKGYVLDDLARQICDNARFLSFSDLSRRKDVIQLFNNFKAYYPDTVFLLDWNNELPNAYAWTSASSGQRFVVCTGGLVRVEKLYVDGLALILAVVIERLNGAECLGDADYAAATLGLRKIWHDEYWPTMITSALDQAKELFRNIREQPVGNPCEAPTTDCRMQTYKRALSFSGVPECARPLTLPFELVSASANGAGTEVLVTFNRSVETATGGTTDNYAFEPKVSVAKATVGQGGNQGEVLLEVQGLDPKRRYLLTVTNVLSQDGKPLDPKHDAVIVRG